MNVQYSKDGINLFIPCKDTAATHARLLQSLISCAGNNVNTGEVLPVIMLIRLLLPDERTLDKGYKKE